MKHPRIVEIIRRAVSAAQESGPALSDTEGTVPVRDYTDEGRLAREREALFRAMPIPIAHASELSEPKKVLVRELDGVSLLLLRDSDGAVRAFKNACRHRGARLLREDAWAKAFVCPYHGWTYATDGSLIHIPHQNAFPSCDRDSRGLVPVNVEERHGIVWACLAEGTTPRVRDHLGALDEELAALELERHVVGERVVTEQRGNWKMLMEAFLDGYHIRSLHRDSVYPFFVDARSIAERAGIHIRAASARRTAKEVKDDEAFAARDLRDLATVTYTLFPCTTIIVHPDWTSLVVVQPLATDRFLWSHTQLLPENASAATAEARAHFARSFALIEGRVFREEDLFIIAETQAGLATGANDVLTFGLLESPALWLHEAIRAHLA